MVVKPLKDDLGKAVKEEDEEEREEFEIVDNRKSNSDIVEDEEVKFRGAIDATPSSVEGDTYDFHEKSINLLSDKDIIIHPSQREDETQYSKAFKKKLQPPLSNNLLGDNEPQPHQNLSSDTEDEFPKRKLFKVKKSNFSPSAHNFLKPITSKKRRKEKK
jgi:hypothetical protein